MDKWISITERAAGVAKAARAEGISPKELDDAIKFLAESYPVTADDVLALVESIGLEETAATLQADHRDTPAT